MLQNTEPKSRHMFEIRDEIGPKEIMTDMAAWRIDEPTSFGDTKTSANLPNGPSASLAHDGGYNPKEFRQ